MSESNLEHQYLQVDGHRIAYLEQGEGAPLMLLHGIPMSGLLWRKILPQLAQTHRVIVPDMLNYGKSDKPAGSCRCCLLRLLADSRVRAITGTGGGR